MAAVTQIRFQTPGRAYNKKLAEGKTKKEALRSLQRRTSNAVYRASSQTTVRAPGTLRNVSVASVAGLTS